MIGRWSEDGQTIVDIVKIVRLLLIRAEFYETRENLFGRFLVCERFRIVVYFLVSEVVIFFSKSTEGVPNESLASIIISD